MAEPRLIRDYLADLGERLPADIVEELADGLDETYRRHLAAGLDPQAAAHAAFAEFGATATITAAFTATAPARRTARTVLRAGPVVGAAWTVALISSRAWDWTVPAAVPLAFGVTLVAVITLLITAALCNRYQAARRAAGTALIGLMTLDVALPCALFLPNLLHSLPMILASTLSLARAAFAINALRRIHAH